MVDMFISYRKYADYKLIFKLYYDEVITTLNNPFEQFDLIKIKSLLANIVLQPL